MSAPHRSAPPCNRASRDARICTQCVQCGTALAGALAERAGEICCYNSDHKCKKGKFILSILFKFKGAFVEFYSKKRHSLIYADVMQAMTMMMRRLALSLSVTRGIKPALPHQIAKKYNAPDTRIKRHFAPKIFHRE